MMPALVNVTIEAPAGTTDHGIPGLICPPARVVDVAVFFIVNYLAHAFTIITSPGATFREKMTASIHALFVPGSGIIRSVRWIFGLACFETDSLARAAKAGALCMVLKKNNIRLGTVHGQRDEWFKKVFDDSDVRLVPINRKVYGKFELPKRSGDAIRHEYFLAEVPPGTPLTSLIEDDPISSQRGQIKLSNNWNVLQLFFSLMQTTFACYTLYKALGNQIDLYGFPAFGLTFAPYGLMSIVNILAMLLTPQYPSMFLVETPDLDFAKVGGYFAGAIAKINLDTRHSTARYDKPAAAFLEDDSNKAYLYWWIINILILVPVGVIGGLSRFRFVTAANNPEQRVWISLWIFVGSYSSLWLRYMDRYLSEYMCQYSLHGVSNRSFAKWLTFRLLTIVPLWIPAVGGLVQVGLRLVSYGSCVRISFNPFG